VPKVFISYSHDSPEHKDRVLALADRLRRDGVNCEIDQYEPSPPEGWPRWMARQIKAADFVLVICTEQYGKRFCGEDGQGHGKGAKWEGSIITQALYDNEGSNAKFVPIAFSGSDLKYIPDVIHGTTHYVCDGDDHYIELYRRLTNQRGIARPSLGKLKSLPLRKRVIDLTSFDVEAADAVATRSKHRDGGRVAKNREHKQTSKGVRGDLVLIQLQDGTFATLPSERITQSNLLSLHVRAEEPAHVAFLGTLRTTRNRQISVAYDLRAASGTLMNVTSEREGGREVWVVEIQEQPGHQNSVSEFSFNGMSADLIAGLRTKMLLLGEQPTVQTDLLNSTIMGWSGRQHSPGALWPALLKRFGQDKRQLVAAARLAFVLELWEAGIVSHVDTLDLKIKDDVLLVDFVGQRPRVYQNREPMVIKVAGKRSLQLYS
jgi:hypothetical protein